MSTATIHTDVECPVDEFAVCGNCGEELLSHKAADPDNTPSLGDAMCVGQSYIWSWGRLVEQFTPQAGESLECPEKTGCVMCDVTMCALHSDDTSTCVDGGIHHTDCGYTCGPCNADRKAGC